MTEDRVYRWARFRISPDDVNYVLENLQGGVCPISNKPPERPVSDHSKSTGCHRGILEHRCNLAIGMLGEDIDTIRRAIDYLQNTAHHAMVSDYLERARARRRGRPDDYKPPRTKEEWSEHYKLYYSEEAALSRKHLHRKTKLLGKLGDDDILRIIEDLE